MSSTSFSVTTNDLAAAMHNICRRYGPIFTEISVVRSGGGSATIAITWPNDAADPGDPGPDPTVVSLGDALSAVTDHLVNEQTRTSTLFAERLDLTAARDALAAETEALAASRAAVLTQLGAKSGEAADLERALVAKQTELDALKSAAAADVKV